MYHVVYSANGAGIAFAVDGEYQFENLAKICYAAAGDANDYLCDSTGNWDLFMKWKCLPLKKIDTVGE